MFLRLTRLSVALTCLAGWVPAHAQLWNTPQATAQQPLLRGFKAQGQVLTQGDTRVTLDVAGGYVVGALVEGSDTGRVARALAGVWDSSEKGAATLYATLSRPEVQTKARRGILQTSDASGTDLLAVRLSGQGKAQRWQLYAGINVLPESTFPATRNVVGKAAAPHVIHVLSDFQCPACRALWGQQLAQWRRQPDQYRIFYHHYPLNYHANAFAAAEASECAARQGRFWNYADRLFEQFDSWGRAPQPRNLFGSYAAQLRLDRAAFDRCLAQRQTRAEVERQMRAAQPAYLQGTPTVYLNGVKLQEFSAEEVRRIAAVTRARPSAASVIASRLKNFR